MQLIKPKPAQPKGKVIILPVHFYETFQKKMRKIKPKDNQDETLKFQNGSMFYNHDN